MKKLSKARISLLKRQPFFGRLCLQLGLVESKDVLTASVDGENIYYNPKFIESVTENQLLGVLCHEVLHVALNHLWRKSDRGTHNWNIACDYATNLIVSGNGLELPTGALIDGNYSGLNAEQIYEKIKKEKTKCSMGIGGGIADISSKKKCLCETSHKMWGKIKSIKRQKEIGRVFQSVLEEVSRERGTLPVGMERYVQSIQPKENWQTILKSYLSSSTSDFDFMSRDRRTLSSDFYFPDIYSEDSLQNIVVAVDTSGSIGEKELSRFLGEVRSILSTFKNVKGWLIDCDSNIGKIVDINKAKTNYKYDFYGGGGTSHKPVFRAIEKKNLKPKVCICFTDLYTEFPDKKPNYPVLWLTTEVDMKVPFGRIIKMKV